MANPAIPPPLSLTTDGLLGKRYAARFIDSLIVFVAALAIFGLTDKIKPRNTAEVLFQIGVCLVLYVGYGAAFEASPWQATLGKRLMGLRVYDGRGNRLSGLQATERNLVKEAPFIGLAFLPFGNPLAFLWLCAHLFAIHRSPISQAIHDRVAHTLVAAPEETTQLRLA